MLIFKYLSPAGAFKVLEHPEHVSIRFGLPRTYNDPYELFLQTDKELQSDELRAFFEHILGEIPQFPVTCFSRVPDSVALWAHYAREQSGICLGFDESELTDQFPIVYIDDVNYSDEPAQIKSAHLEYAFATGKRRHTLRVLEIAHRAAYLIKRTEWQYERERRLVVGRDDVQAVDGFFVANIASKPLRLIILGSNVEASLKQLCETRAGEAGVPIYEVRNGRRTYQPFFVESDKSRVFTWKEGEFQEITSLCPTCREPGATPDSGECVWCSIDPETRRDASIRSALSVALLLGVEKYIPLSFDNLKPKGWKAKVKEADPEQSPNPAAPADQKAPLSDR